MWAKRFEERNIPIIGDDIKAQIGATIVGSLSDLVRLLDESEDFYDAFEEVS